MALPDPLPPTAGCQRAKWLPRREDRQVYLDEFREFAAEQARVDLFDQVEDCAGDKAYDKAAEVDAPVDLRVGDGKRDVQSDIDREEVRIEAGLAEDPQAKQRSQNTRRRARGADREIGACKSEIADDRAEDHRTEIDDQEIQRADALFEMRTPQHEAEHVHREMDEVEMQKSVSDQTPVFVPRQRGRIHRAVAVQ
jgi:hypothetical protein